MSEYESFIERKSMTSVTFIGIMWKSSAVSDRGKWSTGENQFDILNRQYCTAKAMTEIHLNCSIQYCRTLLSLSHASPQAETSIKFDKVINCYSGTATKHPTLTRKIKQTVFLPEVCFTPAILLKA